MRQKLRDYIFESKNRVNNQDTPVFSVTNDKGFIPSSDCFDKVVHSKDIGNYKRVSPSFLCYNPSRINMGYIALNTTDQVCAVSPMYTVFGCDAKKLLPEYLLLFLKSAIGLKTINSKTLCTVRFQLKFDYLKNIDLRIPDIQEQQHIIDLIEEIDDLRQKQRKAIELTRQMIPALFYEMFSSDQPTKALKDLIKIHYGKALKNADRKTGTFPVFGSNGCIGSHNEALIEFPTIIIGRKGSVGKVTFAKNGGWPIDTTYYVEHPREMDLYYLYWVLKLSNLERLAISTSLPGLNRDTLYDTTILVPPIELQKIFTQKAQECLSLLEEQEKSLQKLDALFESTLNASL